MNASESIAAREYPYEYPSMDTIFIHVSEVKEFKCAVCLRDNSDVTRTVAHPFTQIRKFASSP